MKQEAVSPASASPKTFVQKILFAAIATLFLVLIFSYYPYLKNSPVNAAGVLNKKDTSETEITSKRFEPTLSYKEKMEHIINGDSSGKWKMEESEPLPGAILPYKRIIAFYGNLYSKNMGILGELPKQEVLDKLQGEVMAWEKADTFMQVQPALHYIAVTAQLLPGTANKYRLRMPFSQIDSVLKMAE